MSLSDLCSEAFWVGFCWARGLGLPGPAREANFIPVSLFKMPMVREWRHLSAGGLASPRLSSVELARWQWRSAQPGAPAAYAILPGSAGLVVVDVDDPSLVPALERLYGRTPVQTHTPSGGRHMYYLAPEGDPESADGLVVVKSRTEVRGPRTYDVKAAGSMCHMPGGASDKGEYSPNLEPREWEPGELRAMLPTFPVARYEADWLAHHPEAQEWTPQGERVDDITLPVDWPGAADLWAEAIEAFGAAGDGERHSKGRRLALQLGDRGCPQEEALVLMLAWNRTCLPPEEEARVRALVVDAYRTRRSALGWRVPESMLCAPGATEAGDQDDPAPVAPGDDASAQDGAQCATDDVDYPALPDGFAARMLPFKGQGMEPPADRDLVQIARELLSLAERGRAVPLPKPLREAAQFAEACWIRGLSSVQAQAELDVHMRGQASATARTAARLWTYVDGVIAGASVPAALIARTEVPREVFGGAPWFLTYAEAAVRSLPLHADASILTGLSMFNIALRDTVDIVAENADGSSWTPAATLYAIVEAKSGAGKSGLMKAWGERALAKYADPGGWLSGCEYSRAIEEFTDEREDALREYQAQSKPRVARTRADASQGAQARAAHNTGINAQLAKMVRKPAILGHAVPCKPAMLLADTTPQEFVRTAVRSGYVALVSTEGKSTLEKFLSREGEQSDPLLTGFSRDPYRRARVGEAHDPASLKARDATRSEFAAAALLMVQPGVLSPSSDDEGRLLGQVARRGLLARFIIGRPPQLTVEQIVARDADARAQRKSRLVADVMAPRMAVHALIAHMLREMPPQGLPPDRGPGGDADEPDAFAEPPRSGGRPWPVHPLAPRRRWQARLTDEANELIWDFKLEMLKRSADGGDLASDMLGELARRLHEIVVRLAASLRYLALAQVAYNAALEQARDWIDAGQPPRENAWRAPVTLPPVLQDTEIGADDIRRAIVLAHEYLLEQARMVYRRAVYAPSEDDAETLAAWLAQQRDRSATRAEMVSAEPFSRGWLEKGRGGRSRLDLAIQVLTEQERLCKVREAGCERFSLVVESAHKKKR